MDSADVAHIVEHTVLCGSEKFPVRNPFFKMLSFMRLWQIAQVDLISLSHGTLWIEKTFLYNILSWRCSGDL